MIRSRSYLALIILAVALLGSCQFGGEGPPPTPLIPPRPTPRPTPAPTPTPTPTATPTPVPGPTATKSKTEVEQVVWGKVRSCTDQVTLSAGTPIAVAFDTQYSQPDGKWLVSAFSKTPALSFGLWQVMDSTGEVTPADEVAKNIALPDIVCDQPVSFLATGKTPPRFLPAVPTFTPTPVPTPLPTPTPIPTPTMAVATAEEAQLRVWIKVYGCYRHPPESTSFTAYKDDSLQRWIVEGKSALANYGLWLVDAVTGEITPWDKLAKQAAETCTPTPAVLTSEQAQLRVWVSVYDCFDPHPKYSDFTAYQESPQRWVVEGIKVEVSQTVVGEVVLTEETRTDVYYGLWLVDTDTARVVPWNVIAKQIAAKACYRNP